MKRMMRMIQIRRRRRRRCLHFGLSSQRFVKIRLLQKVCSEWAVLIGILSRNAAASDYEYLAKLLSHGMVPF